MQRSEEITEKALRAEVSIYASESALRADTAIQTGAALPRRYPESTFFLHVLYIACKVSSYGPSMGSRSD